MPWRSLPPWVTRSSSVFSFTHTLKYIPPFLNHSLLISLSLTHTFSLRMLLPPPSRAISLFCLLFHTRCLSQHLSLLVTRYVLPYCIFLLLHTQALSLLLICSLPPFFNHSLLFRTLLSLTIFFSPSCLNSLPPSLLFIIHTICPTFPLNGSLTIFLSLFFQTHSLSSSRSPTPALYRVMSVL